MQNWVTSWISEKFSFNVHEKMSRWGGWQWRSLKKKTLNYLFYKGAELSRLTKICPNDSHERVWSQTLLFLYIGTYQVGTGTFFQLTQIKCILLWLLHSRILPILQTGRMFWVDTMWAARTSPVVAAKSSMWASTGLAMYSKTGILNLFTSGMGGSSICGYPKALRAAFLPPT